MSDITQNFRIVILMISNFGVADGGRETWAYNFIPRLLKRWPSVILDLIGLNRSGEPDNEPSLTHLLAGRGEVTFLHSTRQRYVALSMVGQAPRALSTRSLQTPDLVIGVGSAVELLVMQASPALRRAPKIIWLRTILVDEKSTKLPKPLRAALRSMEVRLLRTADLLIANGEDTARYYRDRGLSVVVIPNGIDIAHWNWRQRSWNAPLRVTFVGRLIAEKGVEQFLRLARALHDRGNFEFHVVGEGPLESEVRRALDEGWVVAHGAVSNSKVREILAETDVCVGFSFEGGGGGVSNALLEQMASGCVIIAWQNAIYAQLLDHSNAFLVRQGDVEGAQLALEEVLDQPAKAQRIAANARKTAENYSFEAHIDKFVAVAEVLLMEKRP